MTEMRKPQPRDSNAAHTAPGDPIARMSEMLETQALSLNAMFVELAEKAAYSLGKDYHLSAERYARLALRAQSNCRSAIEALARADRLRQRSRDGKAA